MEDTSTDSVCLSKQLPDEKTFEIGLVLAGAVSAGAYTAGVLDFMFEALDEWALAKERGDAVPQHDVVLRTITGASAGGMNGAIAASALRYDFPHVRATDSPGHNSALGNPFYAAWVKKIDMRLFLGHGDLGTEPLPSLLDSSALESIVKDIVEYVGPKISSPVMRDWIANPLPILLTISNLRGVPYDALFSGLGQSRGHTMVMHQDHVGFAAEGLSGRKREAILPDLASLPPEKKFKGTWESLGMAALATGAFPGFLAARLLSRPVNDYEFRYPVMNDNGEERFRKPAWKVTPKDPYRFLCVDGGAMNNEPFELARTMLAGIRDRNPRGGNEARRAVVMIDPLTDSIDLGPDKHVSIPQIAGLLMSSLIHQARFTPSQYALATDDSIYSRFMIAPSRGAWTGDASLAGAGLGAFLGFFSESYRRHDFLLGRRNCQRFLQRWFTLPADNLIIENSISGLNKAQQAQFQGTFRNKADHYQIIPLVGNCAKEERLPCWPAGQFKRDTILTRSIKRRITSASTAIVDELFAPPKDEGISGLLTRRVAKSYVKLGLLFARGRIARIIEDQIDSAITEVDHRESADDH